MSKTLRIGFHCEFYVRVPAGSKKTSEELAQLSRDSVVEITRGGVFTVDPATITVNVEESSDGKD